MISTRDLSKLPDIDGLKRLMQSMAMLDAILSPKWESRYYSFNSKWANGEQMGSMRNGQGDDLHSLFTKHGCFLKGFDHESQMSPYRDEEEAQWPGLIETVPNSFDRGLNQPAFSMENTTFCIWRQYGDDRWHRSDITFPEVKLRFDGTPRDPDGSEWLLSPYDGMPETYLDFAKRYFSRSKTLTLAYVRHVYDQHPLTAELVEQINPELSLADLSDDLVEIGYRQS
ncbi:MAG: hypothetical protein U0792_06305 [Gemmataceae bacterium]